MRYTKEQLANLGGEKIRNNADLFTLFKQYVDEDICELYYNCKLPGNCFGCAFNTTFAKWRNHVLNNSNTKKRKIMSNSKSTYKLKDEKIKIFFDGNVLDKNSTDEDWNKFINYLPEKVVQRKAYFDKLPNSSADNSKEPKPKAPRKAKAAVKDAKAEDSKESNEGDNKEENSNEENK